MFSISQLQNILQEAETEAHKSANEYFQNSLGGQDSFPCGFAWVVITQLDGKKIKGNTLIGKALKKVGIDQDYNREFKVWNPSKFMCQNMDTLEVGARAYANVLKKYGFTVFSESRMD